MVYAVTVMGGHAEGSRGETGGEGDPGMGLVCSFYDNVLL